MATKELTPQEKFDLVKMQLQEVIREETMAEIIIKENRPMSIYWGTATTGRPHCGYFVPMVKIAHFLRAGQRVKILLADVHAFLDNLKAPFELVEARAQYYRYTITALLKATGVPIEKLEFVLGSSYQYTAPYTRDSLKLCSMVTDVDAKKAGAEVVRQGESTFLTGLIYPVYQSLDEEYLQVDAQFGGVDQRKIFVFAGTFLPRIGYKQRVHLMNPILPSLQGPGAKMSSSDPDSKIDLLDGPADVKKKIKKAYAVPKETEGNGIITFVEYVLLPISQLNSDDGKGTFVVERREGEPLVYEDIETLKKDYEKDTLTPQLLKASVTEALTKLLAPIQADFQADTKWQEIEKTAYPPPPEVKKTKKVKNLGTRFPGSKEDAKKGEEQKVPTLPDTAEKTDAGLAKDVNSLDVEDKK